MSAKNTVMLALGTNLGDRRRQLQDAVTALGERVSDIQCSAVYESPALLPKGASEEWNMPFLNMALRGDTALEPHALLAFIKAIEQAQGRVTRGHWGPREIDIDILAYGDRPVSDVTLTIPHRELLQRDFAIIPLAEIAPGWRHPNGKTARELAAMLPSQLKKTEIVIT